MCKIKDKLIKDSEKEIKGQTTPKDADRITKKLGLDGQPKQVLQTKKSK